MATGVLMPKAGISVESCIITQWLKKPGDKVASGDVLFSYETDKASFECESAVEGTLLEIFFNDGDEVPVLINVCAVGNPGEDASALRPAGEASAAEAAVAAPAAAAAGTAAVTDATPAPVVPAAIPASVPEDVKISPRAKKLADSKNIDVRLVAPSGPYGRVVERDVRAAINAGGGATSAAFDAVVSGAPGAYAGTGIGGRTGVEDLASKASASPAKAIATDSGAAYEDVPFNSIRRAISKSMTASLSNIPQLTHNFSFDASDILNFRAQVKTGSKSLDLPDITLNDMILYAVSRIILKYPELNAHMLDGNTIRYFKDVNLGIAVDTERGLLVPVLRQANRKSLAQISTEAKSLAKQAQAGTLPIDDMSGGTFTISNLGSLGVESFTPVINPPQTGILGVNTIIKRPKEVNGEVKLYPAMGLSLTYDHRAIDGAPASRFGKELCDALANFLLLLAV